MKISKLFHWLYFAVMMLPIMVYPIFALAVRSDNNYHSIEISVDTDLVVDFNQLLSSMSSSNSIYTFDNGLLNISGQSISTAYSYSNAISLLNGNKYYIKGLSGTNWETPITTYFNTGDTNVLVTDTIITASSDTNGYFNIRVQANEEVDVSFYPQVFNLTQMFGVGNEPTIQQFNAWYSDDYYSFVLSHKQLLDTGTFVTLTDTDIGSQMVYVGYKVVDNYFNYDSVFNFGSLYSWLELNFFNGNAPLGFFIFWHLLIYWLLTSLLWLLFDVLMYVPQLIHRWLDKASLS